MRINYIEKLLSFVIPCYRSEKTISKVIDEIIATQIKPYLDTDMKRITEKIKNKYGKVGENSKEVLK